VARAGARRRTPSERRESNAAIEDPEVVLAAATRFLETRSRSVAEVRRRLSDSGYRPELVDVTIGRLTELRVLDDEAFARAWVESRDRAHPRGARALRQELRAKGIADDVASRVIEERGEALAPADAGGEQQPLGADESAALRLLDRKAALLERASDPRDRRQRGYVLLVRNGFDHELSWRLSARLASADADEVESAAERSAVDEH
jgi:regulatory protein